MLKSITFLLSSKRMILLFVNLKSRVKPFKMIFLNLSKENIIDYLMHHFNRKYHLICLTFLQQKILLILMYFGGTCLMSLLMSRLEIETLK